MSTPTPGQRFGPYLVEAPIGQGGMGVVFRAYDTGVARSVALKTMLATPDAEDRARFLREARLASSLSHPGIAVVHDVGEIDGTPYLAMDLVVGTSLKKAVVSLSVVERTALLVEIAEAVAYAHGQGVIHRDLKPSNVLVDRAGRAILLDFGVAKRAPGDAAPHPLTFETRDDVIVGTAAYMAPEQMTTSKVDARADQFSWAVMAYEILSGVHPRLAIPPGGEPFPVSRPAPLDVGSGDVIGAVERAMSFLAEDRFRSMDDLVAAMRGPAAPARRTASRARGRPRSGLLTFVVALLSVVAIGGVAAAFLVQRRASVSPPIPIPTPSASEIPATTDVAPTATIEQPAPPATSATASTTPSSRPPIPRANATRIEIRGLEPARFDGPAAEVLAANARLRPSLTRCAQLEPVEVGAKESIGIVYRDQILRNAGTGSHNCFSNSAGLPCEPGIPFPVQICIGEAVVAAGFPAVKENPNGGASFSIKLVAR